MKIVVCHKYIQSRRINAYPSLMKFGISFNNHKIAVMNMSASNIAFVNVSLRSPPKVTGTTLTSALLVRTKRY